MNFGAAYRSQFAAFRQDPRLVYLDSAATSLKPDCVIQAMNESLGERYGTVHRSIYRLAQQATNQYELSRAMVAKWIGSACSEQIVFTRGTTDAINIVAHGLAGYLRPGDEILLSNIEHHSNLVPWQMLAKRCAARLCFAHADSQGHLIEDQLLSLISPRTRIVALAHMPNTTGMLHDFKKVFAKAHENGAWCLLDGAQAVTSTRVDVEELGCDFYAFSSHKIYGPPGLGFLWGKPEALEALEPRDGGGEMVDRVELDSSSYGPVPLRLEAGTPPISQVLSMKAVLEFLSSLDMGQLLEHKRQLAARACQMLQGIDGVRIWSDPEKSTIVLLSIDGVHPLDVTTLLDFEGIAVRSGHMCAQPALRRLGLESAIRLSFGVYNDLLDLDRFKEALVKSLERLR